jgi:[protein-PII] uridylyltransferase
LGPESACGAREGSILPLRDLRDIERQPKRAVDDARAQTALAEAAGRAIAAVFQATLGAALPRSAVLAVGEFARGELLPRSPADILILLAAAPDPAVRDAALAEFNRILRRGGMEPAPVVRTIPECLDAGDASLDFTIRLMDRRLLAGDRATHSALEERWPAFQARHAARISQRLCQAARARHAVWHDTFRHLRPNLMETPGGILDLRMLDLLGRLYPERPESGVAFEEAARFFRLTRFSLRCCCGGDGDLLDDAAQERLAAPRGSRLEWMREYYRHARAVSAAARRALGAGEKSQSSLLDSFRDYRARLSNDEFTVSRERLLLRHPRLETDPGMAFRMLEYVARHGIAPSPETERRLELAAHAIAAWVRERRPFWPVLREILGLPSAALAFRVMIDAGLMSAVAPEWALIEDLPVFDQDRKYTVDEHTLAAIEALSVLRNGGDGPRRNLAALSGEIDCPALVACALALHNLDTAEPGGRLARQVLDRLQPPAPERAEIEFLIASRHELLTAAARDPDDPAVVRHLAARLGTVERLKMLAAMSFATLCALNLDADAAAGRMERLWRAYEGVRRELTRELGAVRIADAPAGLPGLAEVVRGFPTRYLRARSAAELAAHLELFELSRPTGVAARLDSAEGGYRVTVIARDRPYLFASLAGAISSFGFNILKAEAFANSRGIILDTFVFADPRRILQLNPPESERLTDLIQRVALGKTDVQRLMRGLTQPEARKRPAPPEVRFDSEASDSATLVEIRADDRPGLLYSLAMAFSTANCNIDVVLIDTQRHRAIDVFYVAHEGRKLTPELQARIEQELLAAC